MTGKERQELIERLERYPQFRGKMLAQLGISRSTYYLWRRRYEEGGITALEKTVDRTGPIWNRLMEKELKIILDIAKGYPELSPRLLAIKITDENDFSVSESTVYRVLKDHGLIISRPLPEMPASKEWRHKTTRSNEIWQIDGTTFFIVGWGYYKLIPVLDDYSRKILAWVLSPEETADSVSEAVELAIEKAGVKNFPKDKKPIILTDNGAAFTAKNLSKYLCFHGIRHIFGKPYHPQTHRLCRNP